MPDRLSLHAPILVNTIGHCAGTIVFGILLYLLLLDWRRNTADGSLLPSIAACLAFLWNLGSLVGMATAPSGDPIADVIIAGSFSVLSLLPAVLLHISLRSRPRFLWVAGYAVSTVAVALHVGDLITGAPRFHYAAILLVTIGFAALTTASLIQEALRGSRDSGGKRLAGAMVLLLFAISFVHFESAHDIKAWSGEAALHHAGIPLALFVLLQDYRFLLLDTFIRFLVNGILAALAVWIAFTVEARLSLIAHASHDPFYAGIVLACACLLLSGSVALTIRPEGRIGGICSQTGRNPLLSRRRFEDNVIIRCIRWYLRFKLSYRDMAEIALELGVSVAPCTILRWVVRYSEEFAKRWMRFEQRVGRSWRAD